MVVRNIFLNLAVVFLTLPNALSSGKKRPQTPVPVAPVVATPVRQVVLKPVETKIFQLPNGSQVNLTSDLDAMLQTVVAETPTLSPADVQVPSDCQTHLEIRSAVSTLELNVTELGITFGYSPSGSLGAISNINGELNVKIGVIAMDFSIWECVGGHCAAVSAASASKRLSRTQAGINIDFGLIHTGAGLVHQTELGKTLREIMKAGINQMQSSVRLNELTWTATVRAVDTATGSLLFDRGASDRIKSGDLFIVYQNTSAENRCGVYRPLGYIHAQRVDTESTLATVDQTLDPSGITPGDIVMVRMNALP